MGPEVRRKSDRVFRGLVLVMLVGQLVFDIARYREGQRVASGLLTASKQLDHRFDLTVKSDVALDERLNNLQRELKLLESQKSLAAQQQQNWLAALEQPTRDRARQR